MLQKVKAYLEKQEKLANKLTIQILMVVFCVFMVLIVLTGVYTHRDLEKREQEKITLLSRENANIARDMMQRMIDKQNLLALAIKNIPQMPENEKIAYIDELMKNVKAEEKNVLNLFYIAEPNKFLANTPEGFSIAITDKSNVVEKKMFNAVVENIYKATKDGKRMTVVDPFKKKIDGKDYMVISVLIPIFDNANNVVGMLGSNIDTEVLNSAPYNNGGYKSFNNHIICGHQTAIINTKDKSTVGKKFLEVTASTTPEIILAAAKEGKVLSFLNKDKDGSTDYRSYVPFYVGTSTVPWISGSSVDSSEVIWGVYKNLLVIIVIAIIGMVVLAYIAYKAIEKELEPIGILCAATDEISRGNLHAKLEYQSINEFGKLAEGLRSSTQTINTYIVDIDRAMGEMARGNFDLEPSQPFIGDFKGIEQSIGAFIMQMSSTLDNIVNVADQVSESAKQMAMASDELADGSNKQSIAVQDLTKTLDKIAGIIRATARNANEANEMAQGATTAITVSNTQVKNLSIAMNDIYSKSTEIRKIIKTIEDIAFQTNILAINAAIEAANAGEAGLGFAVVAEQVRQLASKSAQAAQNTNKLIETSLVAIENGVKLTEVAASDLQKVVDGAAATTKVIGDITKASGEQSIAIDQITEGLEEISSVIQTTAATSQESAAASEELNEKSNALKGLVNRFTTKKI